MDRATPTVLTGAPASVAGTQLTTTFTARLMAAVTLRVADDGGGDDTVVCDFSFDEDARLLRSGIPDTATDRMMLSGQAATAVPRPSGTYAVAVICSKLAPGTVTVEDGTLIVWAVAG